MRKTIIVDLTGVNREEVKELKHYLESNCWKWEIAEFND